MQRLFSKIRRPTRRYTLLFGLLLAVIEIVLYNLVFNSFNLGGISIAILWIICLGCGFFAGQRTVLEAGKIRHGMVVGFAVGLIGTTINALVYFPRVIYYLSAYVNLFKANTPLGVNPAIYTPSYVLLTIAISLVMQILLTALFSALGGLIGGFLGRRSFQALEKPVFFEDVSEETDERLASRMVGDGEAASSLE